MDARHCRPAAPLSWTCACALAEGEFELYYQPLFRPGARTA